MLLWTLLIACPAPEPEPATSECPSIAAPEGVELTGALLAESLTTELVVTNACTDGAALDVAAVLYGDPGLSIEPPSVTVAPGGEGRFTVAYTADGYVERDATIVLSSNDPSRPELAVSVSAMARADQDGDGHEAIEAGGDDCDDQDGSAKPGATEIRDLSDDDCDGLVDEDLVAPGDVWITEIMVDPAVTADADGEWVELYNASAEDVALIGWQLADASGNVVVIDSELVLASGGRAVLGAREDANNGGAPVEWAWGPGALDLGQPAGGVSLRLGDVEISAVAWEEAWGIDPGASWGLDPLVGTAERVPNGMFWCPQLSRFGAGDRGTPGAANDVCRSVDHDGDGESESAGDCDDADPTVHEGATEIPNGVDDDCDDLVDEG